MLLVGYHKDYVLQSEKLVQNIFLVAKFFCWISVKSSYAVCMWISSLTSHILTERGRVWSRCNHQVVTTGKTCCDQWDLYLSSIGLLSWRSQNVVNILLPNCTIVFLSNNLSTQRDQTLPLRRVWFTRSVKVYQETVVLTVTSSHSTCSVFLTEGDETPCGPVSAGDGTVLRTEPQNHH